MSSEGEKTEDVLASLSKRGYRLTEQRRAIVREVMRVRGHISPQQVVGRVQERIPGVNASTVYRTLDMLEDAGVVAHAHLENGAEYHRVGEHDHVHLVCARCGRQESIVADDVASAASTIVERSGFEPDFTHFAISGLCAQCVDGTG
jgi:Fur family ferric uptake transcriptional regulator